MMNHELPSDWMLRRMREHMVGHETEVPLMNGQQRRYIHLDNAASTPVMAEVMQQINRFMRWYSSVHRGAGFKSQIATQAYEDARRIVREFVGANAKEHVVIFGKNSTEAINKLSYRLNLTPEDVVLITTLEHHSNDLPWRGKAQVRRIGIDAQGALDMRHAEQLLVQHRGKVKLLAITGASNVTGFLPDVHALARMAHEAGAQILVDAAQLAPHRAIAMGELSDAAHLDYVALSAHKLYAPFGSGALIARRDTFEQGEPEYAGGGTIDLVTPEEVMWAEAPERDEAGTPNVVGAVAMASAMLMLKRIGMANVAEHEAQLTQYALERLSRIEGLQLYGDRNPTRANTRLGVITFNIAGMHHHLVAAILSAEFGIGVRSGCFCAHPYLMKLLQIDTRTTQQLHSQVLQKDRRQMPGMVRLSVGLQNTHEDIDALAVALKLIAAKQYQGEYAQDSVTGDYSPRYWKPELNRYFDLHSFEMPSYREEQCLFITEHAQTARGNVRHFLKAPVP